jgi:hypothetical protein
MFSFTQPIENFFFDAGFSTPTAFTSEVGTTTGDGAAGASGAGASIVGSWNKSVNLLIAFIEFYKNIYQATSSTNSPIIFTNFLDI